MNTVLERKTEKKTSINTMISVMDVAGELRLQREKAESLLDTKSEREQIKQKILASAKISGESLTEDEINRALDAYYEGLHRFQPAKRNLSFKLASAYIKRKKILLFLGIPLIFISSLYYAISGTVDYVKSYSHRKVEAIAIDSSRTLQNIKSISLETSVVERSESIYKEMELIKDDPESKEQLSKLSAELDLTTVEKRSLLTT